MSSVEEKNIGLFTDPSHNIYVADALPSLDEVKSGAFLQPGEVTIAVKSTGICGYVLTLRAVGSNH